MKNQFNKVILFAVLSLVSLSCKSKVNPEFKSIVFRFQDSSVPPEFHRSYTIKVSDDKIYYTVCSYQDTLLEDTFNLTSEQSEKIKSELTKLGESNFQDYTIKEPLMSGSSAQSLDVFYANGKKLEAYCLSDSQEKLTPLMKAMKQLIQDNGKDVGSASYDSVLFKKILTGEIKIDENILVDLKLTLKRGAFHYDSIILEGNTLHHKLTKGSMGDKKEPFSEEIDIEKVIAFYNTLIRKGIYTVNRNTVESKSDASTTDIVIQYRNEKITLHCSHFGNTCPINFVEEEVIQLSSKNLKRTSLPG